MKKLANLFVVVAFFGMSLNNFMPHTILINLTKSIVKGVQNADAQYPKQIYGGVWDTDRASELRDSSG